MITPIVRSALSLSLMIGLSVTATAQTRTPTKQNQLPESFTWKSEYWTKKTKTAPPTDSFACSASYLWAAAALAST